MILIHSEVMVLEDVAVLTCVDREQTDIIDWLLRQLNDHFVAPGSGRGYDTFVTVLSLAYLGEEGSVLVAGHGHASVNQRLEESF